MANVKHDETNETIKTRVDENSAQSETKLVIIWDDAKAERTFASRGVRIAAQAMLRASGTIPAELTVNVSELAKRERGGFAMKPTPQNAQRLLDKLDNAQYAEALAAIGIGAGDIKRMVANRVKAAPLVGVEAKRDAKKPSAPIITTPKAPTTKAPAAKTKK